MSKNTCQDIILDAFNSKNIKTISCIPVVVVTKNPKDYPGKFVARLFEVNKPTRFVVIANNIELIRKLIPANMVRIPPFENDDPVIVEVYI